MFQLFVPHTYLLIPFKSLHSIPSFNRRRPLGQGRQARAREMTNAIRQNQQRLIVRTFAVLVSSNANACAPERAIASSG
ncbi:hypothetical protein KCU74_g25, partial [Aureobasidium melanogenum]